MGYGTTFKKLRQDKGFSLKEASREQLSSAQLSRFENEKSMLTVDQFFRCLTNINVSIEEFQFVHGATFRDRYETVSEEMEKYLNNGELDQALSLADELLAKSQGPFDWDSLLAYFIRNIVHLNRAEPFEYLPEIMGYLQRVENWGEIELRIISLFSFALGIDELQVLLKSILKRAKEYQRIPQDRLVYFDILFNLFSKYIFYHEYTLAEEVLALYRRSLAEPTNLLTPRIDYIFNQGILCYVKGDYEQGDHHFDQAISLTKIFQQRDFEVRLTRRSKHWRENHTDPNFKELVLNLNLYE